MSLPSRSASSSVDPRLLPAHGRRTVVVLSGLPAEELVLRVVAVAEVEFDLLQHVLEQLRACASVRRRRRRCCRLCRARRRLELLLRLPLLTNNSRLVKTRPAKVKRRELENIERLGEGASWTRERVGEGSEVEKGAPRRGSELDKGASCRGSELERERERVGEGSELERERGSELERKRVRASSSSSEFQFERVQERTSEFERRSREFEVDRVRASSSEFERVQRRSSTFQVLSLKPPRARA